MTSVQRRLNKQDHRLLICYILIFAFDILCFFMFLFELIFQGGMYMLQLIDNYAATYSLLIITLFECIALNYVYGKLSVFICKHCLFLNQ